MATGDRKNTSLLIVKVTATKSKALIITNISALFGDILPAGISRLCVRGFWASTSRSKYRLNPMAEFRAKTIQPTTCNSNIQEKPPQDLIAQKNPANANGIQNTVCANRTNEKYCLILSNIFVSIKISLPNHRRCDFHHHRHCL